ncbi:MAG: NAD(P)-dependent oxidoreductase [Candidatus Heimdallarchaeota archaeon]|nr:NAD(P)-dependent oxidoreductase [Candidatus Heimdallarchaeota archaeon]
MKILVTGATGLLGHNVVIKFLKLGFEVVALGRQKDKLEELSKLGAEILEFDITSSYENYNQLEVGASTWIHCAAAVSGAEEHTLHAVNVEGTSKLVKKAEELDIRFIHISSITVYGIKSGQYTEDAPYDPPTKYAISKVQAEEIIINSNLKWTMLRPPYIGGPNDRNFLVEFGERIKKRKMPLMKKNGKIAYIDARDIAEVIAIVIDDSNAVGEIFNVQSTIIGLTEFIELMGDKLGCEKPYGMKIPYPALMTLATLLDLSKKIMGKTNERGISRYRIKNLISNRTMSIDKLMKFYNFKAKYPLEQSIDDWIESIRV